MTAPEGESTPIVVQKFGGTSVADSAGRRAVVARVRAALAADKRVVVVVSAMGRAGAPYATDTLLGLLDGFDVDPREADLLASCGELISAVVLAHELRAAGVPAAALTGAAAGVLTDDAHGDATVLAVDPKPLRAALVDGLVPVVTGFQGATGDGVVTTLGRGGSDTSACAIGAALRAEAVEIYTDVDGVMSADPRVCEGARVLHSLQFEELFQMARAGAKVMHAPAAETAMDAGVPVWVRNTFTQAPGTRVTDANTLAAERRRRVATAVSHSTGISRITVELPSDAKRGEAVTGVFAAMADSGVSLDMFTPLRDVLALSVDENDVPRALSALRDLKLKHTIESGLAKVTLVGAGMHGIPGVMARIAKALAAADVEVLQVADSHYTISVLTSGDACRRAISALHTEFALGVE